jgi:hypothetical protein
VTTPAAAQTPGSHLSDGALLALYDGDDALGASHVHVAQCVVCRSRLDAVAARASAVRRSLESIPVSPLNENEFLRRVRAAGANRARPVWRRPSWQAAAAVIVVAAAAAASPIRAWIERRLERSRAEAVAGSPRRSVDSARKESRSGATVSFAATGPAFTLRFDSLPAAGLLTIDGTASKAVSARVASGAGTGGDDFVILPGELRVRNLASSRATYFVSVPSTVTRVQVIVGGRPIYSGAPPAVVPLRSSP